MENLSTAMERPPAERKYHRVQNEEEETSGFQKVATETTKMFSKPVVLSADLTKNLFRKTSTGVTNMAKAAANGVARIRTYSNDSTDDGMNDGMEDDSKGENDEAATKKGATDGGDMMENRAGALERPPTQRKYHQVDEQGFQKVAADTAQVSVNQPFVQIDSPKIPSTPIVAGVDLDEEVMNTMPKATVDGVEKIRQISRASDDAAQREMEADAAGDEVQKKAAEHKVKEDKTSLLDNDSEEEAVPGPPKSYPMANMKKAMGDTAKIVSGAVNNMTKATVNSVEKIRQASRASDDAAIDTLREMECVADDEEKEEKTPLLDSDLEEETVPEPPRSTPMAAMKKMMGDTAKIVSDKIEKAKNRVVDSQMGQPKLQRDISAHTNAAVVVVGGTVRDNDDNAISTNTVESRTMTWSKKTLHKTTGRFQQVFGRKRKSTKNDDSMRFSIASDVTMDNLQCAPSDDSEILSIVVTPTMAFLLHDITVAFFILSPLAAIPTWRNWNSIVNNQLPSSVIIVWLLFAFFAGMEIGRFRGMRHVHVSGKKKRKTSRIDQESSVDTGTVVTEDSQRLPSSGSERLPPSEIYFAADGKEPEPPCKEGNALFINLLTLFLRVRLMYPEDAAGLVKKPVAAVMDANQQFWSTLNHDSREAWETVGFVKVADPLMNRLLRNPDYQRKPLKLIALEEVSVLVGDASKEQADTGGSGRVGAIEISKYDASTLENDVVDPCFKLRGMDVFLTDDPEDCLSSHPFLLKEGLRDKPTMLVNVMVQWANILVYFELPDWFTDFDKIVEHDDDPNEVLSIKRFITGDDAYRNARFKVLPCLVDGPLPVRIIAPPKKEVTVHGSILPTEWKKHPAETTRNGTTLQPCLELEVDIVSNSTLRNVSGMLRRYIKHISLDLAIIIEKPTPKDEDEPSACIGLWRFDHIDVDRCPRLPDRNARDTKLQADVRRASAIVHLTPNELATITEDTTVGAY